MRAEKAVGARFPSAQSPEEIWNRVDASQPKQIALRRPSDSGGKKLLREHPENLRNLVSAQKTYLTRIWEHGCDPNGRGP